VEFREFKFLTLLQKSTTSCSPMTVSYFSKLQQVMHEQYMSPWLNIVKPLTTGFGAFAKSGDPLGEGPFPLVEAFAERKLSTKVTRCTTYR
jgi:hypothetical protein